MRVNLGRKILRTVLTPFYKKMKVNDVAQEVTSQTKELQHLPSNRVGNMGLPLKPHSGKIYSNVSSKSGNTIFKITTFVDNGKVTRRILEGSVIPDFRTLRSAPPIKHGSYDKYTGRYSGIPFDEYMKGENRNSWVPDITRVKLSSVEGNPNLFIVEKAQKEVAESVKYVRNDARHLVFDVSHDICINKKIVDVTPDELIKKIAADYDNLDKEIKNIRILKDDGRILSPKVQKHRTTPIESDIFAAEQKINPKYVQNSPVANLNKISEDEVRVSAKEMTQSFIAPQNKYFAQAENEFIAVRNSVLKHGNYAEITSEKVLSNFAPETIHPYRYVENGKNYETTLEAIMSKEAALQIVPQKAVQSVVEELVGNKEVADAISKFVKEDLVSLNKCSKSTIRLLTENYLKKFARFSLEKPELISSASKSLKDCSLSEFMSVLAQVAPKRVAEVERMQFSGDLVDLIKVLTHDTSVDRTTKLVDVLANL